MKKVSIFILSLFAILFLYAGIIVMTVNAYSVNGVKTDSFSFMSTSESKKNYGENTYGVKNEDILYYNNNIELYYDTKTKSTNQKNIYEAISKIVVKTTSLPELPFGGGYHDIRESILSIEVFKDGALKETILTPLKENSSSTITMDTLNEKYGYYQFRIIFRYKIYHSFAYIFNEDRYIECISENFYVNTKDISGFLTKTVYDVNSNTYTEKLQNGGVYKTDNKNLIFKWDSTTYDNPLDTIVVLGAVCDSKGNTLSGYEFIRDGQKGYNFHNFANGTYILKLKTELGKSVQYTLIFEEFAPMLNIESGIRKDGVYFIEYNSKISWTDTDSVIQVELNGVKINNGEFIEASESNKFRIEWNTEYTINVTKRTGAIEQYTIIFTNKEQVDLNFNQNSLQKSPIGRWYETYLLDTEKKIYNSWASYDNALAFAIERENATVTQAYYDGGTWTAGIGMDDPINRKKGYYYIYKQRNNPSEKNAYFTKEALDSSILGYAKESIKNYTYFSKSEPATPYENEKVYKTFREGDYEYNLFLTNSCTIYKRPYVDLWINGVKQNFGYENSITISTTGQYKIQEINPFNDTVSYYIHIQKSAPNVEYIMKDTSNSQILTSTNTRFGDFFDLILSNDLDDDSLLIIEKSGIGSVPKVYTYAELLAIKNQPKLESNFLFNETGQYTITAINHWTSYYKVPTKSYTFYVSVNPPYINEPIVDKEKNELTLSFSVPAGEYQTQITSVVIQKYIESTGVLDTLSVDSKGNKISPTNTSYIFNTKGYYIITITDNFARTYERSYAFSREKPSAILQVGNSEIIELDEDISGYFNKKVTITWFDKTITAKMYGISYTWVNGVMIKKNLNALNYINGTAITIEGYYIIELIDIDFNSRRFTFFIDQKAPTMNLFSGGEEFNSGAFKNTDISAVYTQNSEYEAPILVNVKKDSFPISYPENGLFTDEGLYEISITDLAGNQNTYIFTIDKTAPEGFLYLEDGSKFTQNGITNKKVYCTWTEDGVTATCNDQVYYKGSLLFNNNNDTKIYKIILTDRAGNKSIYTFQISKDIPIIVMKTESGKIIPNNSTVDEAFLISWEDPNYTYKIEIIKNGKVEPFFNYTEISSRIFKFLESGSYQFTFKNGNGNTYIYKVNANMKPYAIITAGIENLNSYDYTNKEVKITISDRNSTIEVFLLDTTNNNYKTYTNWSLNGYVFMLTEDGTYKIVIKNDFNQVNTYYFTIKTSLPEAIFTDSNGNSFDITKEHFGNILVSYNKDEVVEYNVYKNGKLIYGNTENLSDIGRYTIILKDKAGNQNTYILSIIAPKNLNWAGIVTLIVLGLAIIGIAIFLIIKFKRPVKLR